MSLWADMNYMVEKRMTIYTLYHRVGYIFRHLLYLGMFKKDKDGRWSFGMCNHAPLNEHDLEQVEIFMDMLGKCRI